MAQSVAQLTYSPLVDQRKAVSGVHLRLHATGTSVGAVVEALNGLSAAWPAGCSQVLVDLPDLPGDAWLPDWAPQANAVLVANSPFVLVDPAYVALGDAAPRVCIRSTEFPKDGHKGVSHIAAEPRTLANFAAVPAEYRRYPLVALDCEEPIEQARAANCGAVAWSGWSCLRWTRKPVDKKVGMLSTILKLIQLIDKDADTADLEALLKRDAVLSYKLVSMANMAAFGLTVEVTSIRHAMNILGREKLKRWLALLLLHAGGADTPQVLLQTAYTRAAFMEALGRELDMGAHKDDLFLCGAFSLLDKILGLPMSDLLSRVSIADAVTDALMEGSGPIGPVFKLAAAVESRHANEASELTRSLALSPAAVNRTLLGAIGSAQSLATA
jgi:hypothetical protein